MPRGGHLKPADDENKQRVYTWRYAGSIHNRLIRLCERTGKSLNYYITKAIVKQIEEDEAKDNK